jgi:hypothetical protein
VEIDVGERSFTHIRLLAGHTDEGRPVYEGLPAAMIGQHLCEVLGSPGLTYGFAAGDQIRLADDGTFEMLQRGGNLRVRLYPAERPPDDAVAELIEAFRPLDGLVEMPGDRRFIVITVPLTAAFGAITNAVEPGSPTARAPGSSATPTTKTTTGGPQPALAGRAESQHSRQRRRNGDCAQPPPPEERHINTIGARHQLERPWEVPVRS